MFLVGEPKWVSAPYISAPSLAKARGQDSPSSDESDCGSPLDKPGGDDRTFAVAAFCTGLTNLPSWSALTTKHDAPRAT
jgi:hypothetical protein